MGCTNSKVYIVSLPADFSCDDNDRLSPEDMLLSFIAANVCRLSYKNSRVNPKAAEIEQNWIQDLRISKFKNWYAPSLLGDESKLGGSLAISGVISDVNQTKFQKPTPFICFRGTTSISEVLSDLGAVFMSPFKTDLSETLVGNAGYGFIKHYESIKNVIDEESQSKLLPYISQLVNEVDPDSRNLLVFGHSLGKNCRCLVIINYCYSLFIYLFM